MKSECLLHDQGVKRAFAKLRMWVASWNGPTWVSAALCFVPLAVLLATSDSDSNRPDTTDAVTEFLLLVLGLPILAAWVGAAQVGMFWFVRHSSHRWLQWAFAASSALLVVPYQRFLATTDLTTNSTAPLAALLYPLYIAVLALPLAALVWWAARRTAERP